MLSTPTERDNTQKDENPETTKDENNTVGEQQNKCTPQIDKKKQMTFRDDIRRLKIVAKMWDIDVSETPDILTDNTVQNM